MKFLFLHYPQHIDNVFLTSVVDGSFVGADLQQAPGDHWMLRVLQPESAQGFGMERVAWPELEPGR